MSIYEEKYCPKHNRTFHGPRCPQCIDDDKNSQYGKITESARKAQQKEEAQQQLRLIFTKLEKAKLVEETADYKRSICPVCHQPSLFFSKSSEICECLNRGECGLNSTIRLLTEKTNK